MLLGAKWTEAAAIVEILAIFGIMRSVSALAASAFLSSGEVRAFAGLSMLHLVLRAIFLGVGYSMGGATGLAWGVVVAASLQMLVSLYVQRRLQFVDLLVLVGGVWRTGTAALVMYLCLTQFGWATWFAASGSVIVELLAQVLVGATIYAAVLGGLWFLSGRPNGPEKAVLSYVLNRNRPTSEGGA